MTCNEAQEHLPAYAGRELDPATQQALEAHLASCPACRAEADALAGVVRAVGDLPTEQPPPGFSDAVMARVRRDARQSTLWSRLFDPLWIKVPAYAVAGVLVVGVGWYVFRATAPAPVQVALQMEDKIESRRAAEALKADEAAPAPETPDAREGVLQAVPELPAAKTVPALPERADLDQAKAAASPPALKAPAAEEEFETVSSALQDSAVSSEATAPPDQELTVAFSEPQGDEQALARLRAAVTRAGGMPLPAGAGTADTMWVAIPSDRLDALRRELDVAASASPGRMTVGTAKESAADSAPPAPGPPPVARLFAQEPGKREAPAQQVRVKVTIRWASPPPGK